MATAELTQIEQLPKLELHIHFEGCFPPSFIAAKVAELNVIPPRPLNQLFEIETLAEFLETLDWICSLISSEQDAINLAKAFGEYCQQQNIIYCELIINPTHWTQLHYADLLAALSSGFDEVEAETGIDIKLLPSLIRQQSEQEALELANWMVGANIPRIVGMSVDGNEAATGSTGQKFAGAYKIVRDAGMGCTAHAGESSGADGVESALDELGVHRIDHGVKVIEDEAMCQRVVDENITLNICISSNCHLLYDSPEVHPFLDLKQAGVKMTLNTDDPQALKTTLNKELTWVSQQYGLSIDDLIEFQHNAINAAFCSDEKKQQLRQMLPH